MTEKAGPRRDVAFKIKDKHPSSGTYISFYFESSKRKYLCTLCRLTLVQDVAHSFCTEAETQMRIADRRIFLEKKPAALPKNGMLHAVLDKEQPEVYSERNTIGRLPNVWSSQDFTVYIGVTIH